MVLVAFQHLGLVDTIGEQCADVYLRLVYFGVVGRVGIEHIVLTQQQLSVAIQYYSRCPGRGLLDAVVPHCHLVIMRTAVKTDQAMLRDAVSVRMISELYGET